MRTFLLVLAAAVAALCIYAMGPPFASATTPCAAIQFEGRKVKIGVTSVGCEEGRALAERFYEEWDPVEGPYLEVEGFNCAGTSAGADVVCRGSQTRWVYATSRPYADLTEWAPPGAVRASNGCGEPEYQPSSIGLTCADGKVQFLTAHGSLGLLRKLSDGAP